MVWREFSGGIRIRVWDIEDKKERIWENCTTYLGEVGTVRRVQIKKGNNREVHHFKVLEALSEESK